MKTLFFLIVTSIIISACSGKVDNNSAVAKSTRIDNVQRDSVYLAVISDLENSNLKYYYSGIASCSPKVVSYLKENFDITVISQIDIAHINDSYYNEFVDSILYSESGKRFDDIYREVE